MGLRKNGLKPMPEESKAAPPLAGLLLAGGASTRMGAPKPIMPWGDQTFLQAIIEKMKAVEVEPVVVVLGAHFIEANEHCRSFGAAPIFHPQWALGQFSSLQAGIGELSKLLSLEKIEGEEKRGVMVALVDQPHIASQVFRQVAEVYQRFPDKLIIPTFQDRRGHPYVIPQDLFSSVLAMPASAITRDFLGAHQPLQMLLPVADAGILFDIDTPEDLIIAAERYAPS
jgi:molybdenum cofactor cytidylyltransferase